MNKPYMPAGWTFEVDTWENDGDNNMTRRHTVATLEDAKFFAKLINLFDHNDLNNVYDPDESELEGIEELFDAFYDENREWLVTYSNRYLEAGEAPKELLDSEEITDLIMDLSSEVGITGQGEFFIRVVEACRVYYSAEPLFLNDVTAEFMPC